MLVRIKTIGRAILTFVTIGQFCICKAMEQRQWPRNKSDSNQLYTVLPFWTGNCTTQSPKNSNSSTAVGHVRTVFQQGTSIKSTTGPHFENNMSTWHQNTEKRYLSRDQYEYYKNIIMKMKTALHWMSAVMCSLAMLSFTRANVCNTSKGFFIALNLFELVTSLISIGSFLIGSVLGMLHGIWATYTLYTTTFVSISSRRVVYILNMMMSAQRMIVVVLPFQTRATFSPRVNLVLITSIVVVTFGTHSYIPLAYRVRQIGVDKFMIANSQLYLDNSELFHGIRDVLVILFSFCPLLVSLLANLFLVYSLRIHFKKAQELRATHISTKGQDGQITYMIISSTLVFTLLSLPANTNHLLETFLPNYGSFKKEAYLFNVIREICYALLVLGDITNFMSYASLSSAFRGYLVSFLSPLLVACTVCEKSNHTQTMRIPTFVTSRAIDQPGTAGTTSLSTSEIRMNSMHTHMTIPQDELCLAV